MVRVCATNSSRHTATLIEENCCFRDHFLFRRDHGQTRSYGGNGVATAGEPPRVVLVAEHELFSVEEKREELKMKRFTLLEACRKVWG